MPCNCNDYVVPISSAGLAGAGSAVISSTYVLIEGGLVCGASSADVDIVADVYDGLSGCWPMDEVEPGPYIERSQGLDGTSRDAPVRSSDGVLCDYSADFGNSTANGGVYCPADDITDAYSVSLWTKIDDEWRTRSLFSRTTDWDLVSCVNYNIRRSVYHSVKTTDGTYNQYLTACSEPLSKDRWYHVAAEWDGTTSSIYVNGSLDGTSNTEGYDQLPSITKIGIGELNRRSRPDAKIQEIRLYPETKGADWWQLEYENHCDGAFIVEGQAQGATHPV